MMGMIAGRALSTLSRVIALQGQPRARTAYHCTLRCVTVVFTVVHAHGGRCCPCAMGYCLDWNKYLGGVGGDFLHPPAGAVPHVGSRVPSP